MAVLLIPINVTAGNASWDMSVSSSGFNEQYETGAVLIFPDVQKPVPPVSQQWSWDIIWDRNIVYVMAHCAGWNSIGERGSWKANTIIDWSGRAASRFQARSHAPYSKEPSTHLSSG